ncbi:hypothetical protein [Streptomyces sp. NPDC056165]|uniref:hypothetical protein n=1 Tax=Streptomyces sp. NPDC056165 TaxID=3345733 RepID=UPI0035DCA112
MAAAHEEKRPPSFAPAGQPEPILRKVVEDRLVSQSPGTTSVGEWYNRRLISGDVLGQPGGQCIALESLRAGRCGGLRGIALGMAHPTVRSDGAQAAGGLLTNGAQQVVQ